MIWREITIFTVPEAEEIISNIFIEAGANGVLVHGFKKHMDEENSPDVYIDNLIVEEPFSISAFYPSDGNDIDLLNQIHQKIVDLKHLDLDIELGSLEVLNHMVDETNWENAWKAYFKPVQVSDFIVIKPTWEEYLQSDDEIIIEIDPGMAFGTGTHESTRMCIRMLEEYVDNGMTVIDMGCGSGILSIVAHKLGAKKVYALDIDKTAVEITKQNLILNGIEDTYDVLCSNLFENFAPQDKADIMVMNIIADVVLQAAPRVSDYIKKNGMLICSGIIDKKVDEVMRSLEKYGFRIIQILKEGEWRAIAFKFKVK